MARGIAPYVDRSEPLGVSRSGWGWDARLADFDNDGTLEALQAIGFLRGNVNRWPELHEIAMGNDDLLSKPANNPFSPFEADLSADVVLQRIKKWHGATVCGKSAFMVVVLRDDSISSLDD